MKRTKSGFLLRAALALPLAASCAGGYVLVADPPAPAGAKWHPGHYALVTDHRYLSMADDPALASEFEAWVASLPAQMVGIQGGAYWRNLEPEKGVYDFRLIDLQLEICRRHGKRLFCMVSEKQFNLPFSPAPDYIAEDYDGIVPMTPSVGQTARIWDPPVLERFCLLVDRLGERYDADPYFEGIEFVETSFSCDPKLEAARGYTVEDYVQAYMTLLGRARAAFPRSAVIQEFNSLPASGTPGEPGLEELAAFCAEIGVGLGGPDLFPDRERNPAQRRISAYELFPRYSGRITLASDVQYPQFAGTMWYHGEKRRFGDFTVRGILDMGLTTLRLNYIFWGVIEKEEGLRFGFSSDVIPLLERMDWPIHSAYPSALSERRQLP